MNAPTNAELVDRAAALLQAHWPNQRMVEFTLDGGRYIARVDFDGYFIVKVFCAEEGELLCKSLPNDPFAIDTGR